MKFPLVKTVLLWRVFLTVISILAITFVIYKPSFPYSKAILDPLGPRGLTAWGNFDGVHYLTIINKGYEGTGLIQAFFPLFPFVIKTLTLGFLNPILIGILLSTTCLLVALYYLDKLIKIDHKSPIAHKTIWLMLLFPTAFFFTSLYTESLFLMLVVLSFYFARKRQFKKAAIFAALASATKVTGIILLPALIIEYFDFQKVAKFTLTKKIKDIFVICLSSLGLGSYMYYLNKYFGDALLFLHVQSEFGSGRQNEKLVMLYQVFYRYIKMLFTVQRDSLLYFTVVSEFTVALLFLSLIILAFKHTRKSYAFFALISYAVPTLTGTFTSMPRYVLVLFPAFIVLAKIIPKKIFSLILILSGILLSINTILFIQGYWIA